MSQKKGQLFLYTTLSAFYKEADGIYGEVWLELLNTTQDSVSLYEA